MHITLFLSNRRKLLESKLKELESSLSGYPEGTLDIYKNGNYHKHYQRIPTNGNNYKRIYLRQGSPLINMLAEKMLILYKIQDIKNEICSIDAYLMPFLI